MSRFDNEPFTLSRDVDAVIVPAGINVKLRTGQSGFITQALGGSFTVYVEGNLFRVAGKDADALGKELAGENIAVNCITPAAAKTRILDQMSQQHVDWMLAKIPRGRFLEIDELASLATHQVGPRSPGRPDAGDRVGRSGATRSGPFPCWPDR